MPTGKKYINAKSNPIKSSPPNRTNPSMAKPSGKPAGKIVRKGTIVGQPSVLRNKGVK